MLVGLEHNPGPPRVVTTTRRLERRADFRRVMRIVVNDRYAAPLTTPGQTPTHTLEPEVPIANIDAFCEACAEYGAFE